VLPCVAFCCGGVQCVADCCSVVQCVTVYVMVHLNTYTSGQCGPLDKEYGVLQCVKACCSVLCCVPLCRSVFDGIGWLRSVGSIKL